MSIAENIGFETKTKNATEIKDNDFPIIYKAFQDAKTSYYDVLDKSNNSYIEISKSPFCFIVKPDILEDRVDAPFYYATYVYKITRDFDKIRDLVDVVKDQKDLSKYPLEEFNYIQFSNIDTKLGSITDYEIVTGENAPDRAKRVVKAGDIICASVKDSEENIAIIPIGKDNIIASTGFIVFRAKQNIITPEALYVLLKQQNNIFQVRCKVSGTIMPSISADDYLDNIVPRLTQIEIDKITTEIKKIENYREHIRIELSNLIHQI